MHTVCWQARLVVLMQSGVPTVHRTTSSFSAPWPCSTTCSVPSSKWSFPSPRRFGSFKVGLARCVWVVHVWDVVSPPDCMVRLCPDFESDLSALPDPSPEGYLDLAYVFAR